MPILPPCRESIKGESITGHHNLRSQIKPPKSALLIDLNSSLSTIQTSCPVRNRATFLTARYPPTIPLVTLLSLTTGQARVAPIPMCVWTTISVSRKMAPN